MILSIGRKSINRGGFYTSPEKGRKWKKNQSSFPIAAYHPIMMIAVTIKAM